MLGLHIASNQMIRVKFEHGDYSKRKKKRKGILNRSQKPIHWLKYLLSQMFGVIE